MEGREASDRLPVRTENISAYVKQYEAQHPVRRSEVPGDPSKRWFQKDPVTECVDRCKYALFETAMKEAGMKNSSEKMTERQRVIHARYAALQSLCHQECLADP